MNESDKKRLSSIKQKKAAFKFQEQTIRKALKCVDNKKTNKKIIFDDNIDVENLEEKIEKGKSKRNVLFNSDDENDEKLKWNEDELEAKQNLKKKLLKLQTNIGNDKRFVLDERFIDDEDENDEKKGNLDDQGELDEKNWQLNILGDVLGKSVKGPIINSDDITKKKKTMIRYDPSASNHQDFEIPIEKKKDEKPVKKKKKVKVDEIEEEVVPIPTSNEIFYDVSDKLIDCLQSNEEFSLLKALGRDNLNIDEDISIPNNIVDENDQNYEGFQFKLNSKRPFQYDSSSNDDDNDDDKEVQVKNNNVTETNVFEKPFKNDDRLFFAHNDSRFREAESFFKSQSIHEGTAFSNRRREIKEIVRSKIKNNVKKSIPWNRKKVRKIQKK